ncbi:15376_t:CDS:2 [Funneliformis geosporum]|uniref:15376_t:CDS:1 n=1 Tax=Funneliformis geosporum TaxID=1117311 RepID=A0A9W4SYP1_9GLOM|nr:15376_t:CDS:2 [Funneliformis geosporum]
MLITLNCLVVSEDPYENAFNVDIDFSKTIDHLRKIIKERINVPNNVKAKDLKLWMVDIPFDEKNDKMDILSTKSKPNIKVDLNARRIKRSLLYCNLRTQNGKFSMDYNSEYGYIIWIKSTYFTFLDGTEEEHIVINCVLGERKKQNTMHLFVDEDLVSIVWTNSFKDDLTIDVDTCDSQQPFSSWTFAKIKDIFSLKTDSYDELPQFDGGIVITPEDIRNDVISDILRKHKVSLPITSTNEATHCEFISTIIYSIVSIYGGTVKVYPQYEISGRHRKGPVDWAIKVGDTIITITEAKREDINQGIAQNTYNEAIYEEVIYEIVSMGVDWVIIKVVSSGNGSNNSHNGNNGKGNVEVFLSSLSPSVLPINLSTLTREDLVELIKNLFLQIKWILNQQISSKDL